MGPHRHTYVASLALNALLAMVLLAQMIRSSQRSLQMPLTISRGMGMRGGVVRTSRNVDRVACLRPNARRALTNAADFRKLSDDKILDEIAESQRALLVLRMDMSNRKEIKTSDFRLHKKKIAQLKHVQREREIEQGVTKRESRRNKKNAFRNMDILKRIRKFDQPGDDE